MSLWVLYLFGLKKIKKTDFIIEKKVEQKYRKKRSASYRRTVSSHTPNFEKKILKMYKYSNLSDHINYHFNNFFGRSRPLYSYFGLTCDATGNPEVTKLEFAPQIWQVYQMPFEFKKRVQAPKLAAYQTVLMVEIFFVMSFYLIR